MGNYYKARVLKLSPSSFSKSIQDINILKNVYEIYAFANKHEISWIDKKYVFS